MGDDLTFLNDEELDGIVGGSFNRNIVEKYNLQLNTSPCSCNMEWLRVRIVRPTPDGGEQLPREIAISDRRLNTEIFKGTIISLSAQDISGEMVELSKDDIESLIVHDESSDSEIHM